MSYSHTSQVSLKIKRCRKNFLLLYKYQISSLISEQLQTVMARHFDIVDVIYASVRPFEELWQDSPTRIWVSMADKSLPEMVSVVIDAIRDQSTPKNILVMVFQKVIGATTIDVMRNHIDAIVTEVNSQRWNKCAISTCFFVPSHEPIWDRVGQFNRLAHKANEDMGVSRVNIHRALMSQVSDTDFTLRIRAAMFSEFQLGLSLGTHLSFEGMASLVRMVKTVMRTAFKFRNERNTKPRETRVVVPPSLAVTAGYNKNKFMRQLMADRGIIRPDRRRPGERRLMMSDQKLSGWQKWQVFRRHGPMHRYQEREGMLDAIIMQLKTADKIPVWGDEDEVYDEDEGNDGNDGGEDDSNAVLQEADTNKAVLQEADTNKAVEQEVDNNAVPQDKGTNKTVVQEAGTNKNAFQARRVLIKKDSSEEPYDPDEWLPDNYEIEIINISDGEVEVHHRPVSQKQADPEPMQVAGDDNSFEIIDMERQVRELSLDNNEEFEMVEPEKVKEAREDNIENPTVDDVDSLKEQLREAHSKLDIATAMIVTYREQIRDLQAENKSWEEQYEYCANRIDTLEIECERLTAQYEYVTNFRDPRVRKGF